MNKKRVPIKSKAFFALIFLGNRLFIVVEKSTVLQADIAKIADTVPKRSSRRFVTEKELFWQEYSQSIQKG